MGDSVCAITFVFNLNKIGWQKGSEAIREFHRRVDKDRLGGRYYSKPEGDRLWFRIVPEKWETHPHFHGFIALPQKQLEELGFTAICEKYEAIWREVCPQGSLCITPLHDALGWASYASKENSLASSLTVIDTYMQSPKQMWSPQRD